MFGSSKTSVTACAARTPISFETESTSCGSTSQNVNYRILYAFVGKQAAILTHGIAKMAKVPDVEINRAIERVKRYRSNPSLYGAKYEE